ncbi:histidine kinase [Streptomyces sp. NPDC059832]|uniref:sensor histidine kinase n=1 Tax=unclassified Streptomyces TaxID=2593676 RepID=UPI00365620ED
MRVSPSPAPAWLRPLRHVGPAVACLAFGVLLQLVTLLIGVVVGGPIGVVAATPVLTVIQRARFNVFQGVEIAPPPKTGGTLFKERVMQWLQAGSSWRQVGYHLLAAPLIAVTALITLVLWVVSVAAVTVFVWRLWAGPQSWFPLTGTTVQQGVLTGLGVVGLYLAATLSRAVVHLDTRAASACLGPSRAERLARRVEEVTESRAGVVDAADAERRRIERDLHDGAQQRLVSLAVNLGLAKATLPDLPEDARKVIDDAHSEAKEAIDELNNLVRGLHPAVLEDRGLDAALSGIAERAPLPVRVRVGTGQRSSPAVEAVAYFVVSEALANVVKHAQAAQVEVSVERIGDVMLICVSDDGVGGADATAGSGLAGLAKRVASIDGTLSVSSPVGGPTLVTVELPCAR